MFVQEIGCFNQWQIYSWHASSSMILRQTLHYPDGPVYSDRGTGLSSSNIYTPSLISQRTPKNSSLIKHRISTSYLNIIWQEKHISMVNKYGAVEIGGKTYTLIRNNCTLLSMLFSHSRSVLSPTETLETLRIV